MEFSEIFNILLYGIVAIFIISIAQHLAVSKKTAHKKMKKTRSAGGVVVNSNGDVLVVNQGGTSWSLPKGHVDEGEDDLTAAKREIYEESGIQDLTLVQAFKEYKRYRIALGGGDDKSELKTVRMFLFTTEEMNLAPIDSHNPEARWVRKDDVSNLLTHRKDKNFFLRIVKKI